MIYYFGLTDFEWFSILVSETKAERLTNRKVINFPFN